MCKYRNVVLLYDCVNPRHNMGHRRVRSDFVSNPHNPDPCPHPKGDDGLCEKAVKEEGTGTTYTAGNHPCPFCLASRGTQ